MSLKRFPCPAVGLLDNGSNTGLGIAKDQGQKVEDLKYGKTY